MTLDDVNEIGRRFVIKQKLLATAQEKLIAMAPEYNYEFVGAMKDQAAIVSGLTAETDVLLKELESAFAQIDLDEHLEP